MADVPTGQNGSTSPEVDNLIETLRIVYPDWRSFDDPKFVDDEIEYKRKAVVLALDLLGRSEFQRLLDEAEFDELFARITKVAHSTNLLYLGAPSRGGLAILNHPDVDKSAVGHELFKLLYGEGESTRRLGRWADWVDSAGLPNKWTFATYLLFLLHPGSEMFVKPMATTRFLGLMGIKRSIRGRPEPATYELILRISRELLTAFRPYGALDMVDVQSVVWVCASLAKKTRYWKLSPGARATEWDTWQREGYAGIGWDELGNTLDCDREQFEREADRCARDVTGWGRQGAEQVWRFVNQLKEGDRILANRGTGEIVGVGTVAGPHYYEPAGYLRHRVPVQWDATAPFSVNEGGWKRTLIELTEEKFKRLIAGGSPLVAGHFSAETFALLKGLNATPTYEWYEPRKSAFKESVEGPLRSLLESVAKRLPPPITERMETSHRLFSRIPKNDWGKGGAWPYYWGAFYPKGARRTESTQLFALISDQHLRYGFGFGDYSNEYLARFLRNVRKYRSALLRSFPHIDGTPGLQLGGDNGPESAAATFEEWLADPERYGGEIRFIVTPETVTTMPRDELVERVAGSLERLFPLVLLSLDDDPMDEIKRLLGGQPVDETNPAYTIEQMSADTGFDRADLQRWVDAIERKGQAVLYGPPGTGKTFVAERLARHIIAEGAGTTDLVQFHPSYAYEDFMQGIRPVVGSEGSLSYDMVAGRFLDFCRSARKRTGKSVLIVDEINRANLARVFGELMYLLEYRDSMVPLAGGGMFSIPKNVRIIGTMNTADRSIALVDHALRRRFAFIYLKPNFEILRKYHRDTEFDSEALTELLQEINRQIADPHYELGISFFLRKDIDHHMEDVWRMEIEPYLEEFFFDRKEKMEKFRWEKVALRLSRE